MVRRRSHRLPAGIAGASMALFAIVAAASAVVGAGAILLPAAPALAQWAYSGYRAAPPAQSGFGYGSSVFVGFRLQQTTCDGCGR